MPLINCTTCSLLIKEMTAYDFKTLPLKVPDCIMFQEIQFTVLPVIIKFATLIFKPGIRFLILFSTLTLSDFNTELENKQHNHQVQHVLNTTHFLCLDLVLHT